MENISMGIILGFTGPIESLTPAMAASAEAAFEEASKSGALLGGRSIDVVRADSTCIDAAAASAAAERLITSDNVAAIMGADCSGVTTAIANNVAVPNGVVMVSPSATSPALTTINDKGYFFRTAPSDARQGEVLASVLMDRGIKDVAVTYTNNDYGKGFADAFNAAFAAKGGSVSVTAAHEDGKADYSAEVAALSAGGSDVLVVLGYIDQGGRGIIQSSLDADAFSNFAVGDGMIGQALIDNINGDITGLIGTLPGSDSDGAAKFASMLGATAEGPYTGESYDAAALIVLAAQAGGNADRATIQKNLMSVANAPGTQIMPGELGKALKILADGGQVDYQGATNVELTDVGEAAGSYKELEVKNGKFETIRIR
ncbi:MAG: ABC transporter substrate-binding protein [Candidatus Puniceispirillaceae bacterium]